MGPHLGWHSFVKGLESVFCLIFPVFLPFLLLHIIFCFLEGQWGRTLKITRLKCLPSMKRSGKPFRSTQCLAIVVLPVELGKLTGSGGHSFKDSPTPSAEAPTDQGGGIKTKPHMLACWRNETCRDRLPMTEILQQPPANEADRYA